MKIYICILCLFIFASCNFINPFRDEGKNIETIIELDEFTHIEINNIFNIEIVEDSDTYIIYKGGERIFDKMKYSSLSGELILDHNFMNWTNRLDVPALEIHMPKLERIDMHSSGTIKSMNQLSGETLFVDVHEASDAYEIILDINYNKLNFHSQGSIGGTFKVSGLCPSTGYTLNGSTNVKATELISTTANVVQNSLGDAYIYTTDKLTAIFYKSGDIYYTGNPEIIETKYVQINNQDASGKLIPLTD